MNSIIAIGLGILAGGVSTSLYYNRKINGMVSQILDIKTVNKLLKEHTSKSDAKKKSKGKGYKRSTKKRVSANGQPKKS